MLVRARLDKRDEENHILIKDSRPFSPTLHMLEDLEMESKGLKDLFTSHPDQPEDDILSHNFPKPGVIQNSTLKL